MIMIGDILDNLEPSEMVEAATEFRKNGFNDSDAATLAKTAT